MTNMVVPHWVLVVQSLSRTKFVSFIAGLIVGLIAPSVHELVLIVIPAIFNIAPAHTSNMILYQLGGA